MSCAGTSHKQLCAQRQTVVQLLNARLPKDACRKEGLDEGNCYTGVTFWLHGRRPYTGVTFATFDWTAVRYILDKKLVPETLANDFLAVLDRPAVQISAAQRFKKVM